MLSAASDCVGSGEGEAAPECGMRRKQTSLEEAFEIWSHSETNMRCWAGWRWLTWVWVRRDAEIGSSEKVRDRVYGE